MSTGFSSVCTCAIKGNRDTDMRCLKTTLLYISHKGASLTLCSDLVKKNTRNAELACPKTKKSKMMDRNEPLKMQWTGTAFTHTSFRFFYKVIPEPSSTKTSSQCLKDSSEEPVPWICLLICFGLSRAWQAERMCFVAGREAWAAGNWAVRELSSLICCQTPFSDLHPSVHPCSYLVCSSEAAGGTCSGRGWWSFRFLLVRDWI